MAMMSGMMAPVRRAAQVWVAALLLFVLALASGLDGIVCGGEGVSAHAQPPAVTAAVADVSREVAAAVGHADGSVCDHGHCHHTAPAQAHAAVVVAAPAQVVAILTPTPSRPLTGGLADPLERPPRA